MFAGYTELSLMAVEAEVLLWATSAAIASPLQQQHSTGNNDISYSLHLWAATDFYKCSS